MWAVPTSATASQLEATNAVTLRNGDSRYDYKLVLRALQRSATPLQVTMTYILFVTQCSVETELPTVTLVSCVDFTNANFGNFFISRFLKVQLGSGRTG